MIKNPTMLLIGITLVVNGIAYIVCALLWK